MIPSFFVRLRPALVAGALLVSVGLPASVSAAPPPTIGEVSPVSATVGVPVTMSASVSAPSGILSCNLYVDLEDQGAMTVSGGIASLAYTFPSGGSRIAFVFCRDNDGHLNSGPNASIWVTGAATSSGPFTSGYTPTPAPTSTTPGTPAAGSLVKLACSATANTDDPCKAVYYYGADGKRHGFPNAKVFFTWYQNFDSVQTVSSTVLGNMPLGKNVTYRPGVRMVKFTSVNSVYVVARGAVLRWVSTEAVATALYGADWNTKIDDVSDVFYTNYTFGTQISAASDFNPTTEMNQAATIDANLGG